MTVAAVTLTVGSGFTRTFNAVDVEDAAGVPWELSVTTTQYQMWNGTVPEGACEPNATLPVPREEIVWTSELPLVHVEVALEYSLAVYGAEPPDQVALIVTPCPRSIVIGDAGETVTALSAGFSVIAVSEEKIVADGAVVPVSVACTS